MYESFDHLSLYGGDTDDVIIRFITNYGVVLTMIVFVLLLILCLVGVVNNSMLLRGVEKEKGDLLISWLVWDAIFMVLYAVSGGYIIGYIICNKVFGNLVACLAILLYSTMLLLDSYMWTVVNSYRKVLIRPKEQELHQEDGV